MWTNCIWLGLDRFSIYEVRLKGKIIKISIYGSGSGDKK